MLIVIQTHQQQMSLRASALQVERTRKKSLQEINCIHSIPTNGHHQKSTKKQPVEYLPTRDLQGRVREKLNIAKMIKKKLAIQANKKVFLPLQLKFSHIFGWQHHQQSVQRCSEIVQFGHYHVQILFLHKGKFGRIALDSCEI